MFRTENHFRKNEEVYISQDGRRLQGQFQTWSASHLCSTVSIQQ